MKTIHPAIALFTILVGCMIVFLPTHVQWVFAVTGFGITGIFSAAFRKRRHSPWFALAHLPGTVTPTLLHFVIIFSVLTPIAIPARMFRKKNSFAISANNTSSFIDCKDTFYLLITLKNHGKVYEG
jgi:hypothetical protein